MLGVIYQCLDVDIVKVLIVYLNNEIKSDGITLLSSFCSHIPIKGGGALEKGYFLGYQSKNCFMVPR